MSIAHLAAVANLATPSPACKALLWALAYGCSEGGLIDRDLERLAFRSGMTVRSVRNNLAVLLNRGWLTPKGPALYQLTLPA